MYAIKMCNCNVLIILAKWHFVGDFSFLFFSVPVLRVPNTHIITFYSFHLVYAVFAVLLLSARWQCNLWLLIARTTKVDFSIWDYGLTRWLAVLHSSSIIVNRMNLSLSLSHSPAGSLIKNHTFIYIEWWEISLICYYFVCACCEKRPTFELNKSHMGD